MLKYYVLLVIPIVFGLVHAMISITWLSSEWLLQLFHCEILTASALACFGYWRATRSFKSGEYLRRGWMYLFIGAVLSFSASFLYRIIMGASSTNHASLLLAGVLLTVANLLFVIGIWVLSRTWKSAGLEFMVSKLKVKLIMFGAIVFGICLAGPTVWYGFWDLVRGKTDGDMVSMIISGSTEIIALSLIAPMLLTAHALYEGPLRWPWIFLAATVLSFLCTDACFSWDSILGVPKETMHVIRQIFHIFGCMYGFSAGMSQSYVQRDIRSKKPLPV